MSRRRFHVDDLDADPLWLGKDDARHARRVLRLGPGDRVELFDGRGGTAEAEVAEVGAGVRLSLLQREELPPPTDLLAVAAAVPKGDRAATMVEKLSELGVDCFIPLRTDRSVVDPRRGKLERFERIAVESAKQCRRPHVMRLAAPSNLMAYLREPFEGASLLADPAGSLGAAAEARGSVRVLVGPEGGLTDAERDAALAADFVPWALGANIMRIETAAIAAAAILAHLRTGHGL